MGCAKHPQWQGMSFCPTCDRGGLEPAIGALVDRIATESGGKKLNEDCEVSALALQKAVADLRDKGVALSPGAFDAIVDATGATMFFRLVAHFLKVAAESGWHLQKGVQ